MDDLVEKVAEMKYALPILILCMFQWEQVSGMNKICFYDCLGSQSAITLSSVAMCPLSVEM